MSQSWRRSRSPGRSEGNAISGIIFNFAYILITIMIFAVFARSVLSWFPMDPRNPFAVVLHDITEPLLGPLRRIVPTIGMIDITPMVAIIVLLVIQRAIQGAG